MHFVIDNLFVMRRLFGDGTQADVDYANKIIETLKEGGNVIARAESRKLLKEARSTEFLGLLLGMPIEIESGTTDYALTDTLQLARRHKLSTYDASYLKLALRKGLPLATNDADLRKALATTGGILA